MVYCPDWWRGCDIDYQMHTAEQNLYWKSSDFYWNITWTRTCVWVHNWWNVFVLVLWLLWFRSPFCDGLRFLGASDRNPDGIALSPKWNRLAPVTELSVLAKPWLSPVVQMKAISIFLFPVLISPFSFLYWCNAQQAPGLHQISLAIPEKSSFS